MDLNNCLVFLLVTIILECVQAKLGGITLRGVTIESPPFVMKINNNHFEGYAIDLITELAKFGDFKFTLYTSPDNKYGSQDNTGRPSGMINEIFLKRADFAVADLTKSMLRERYVDFTDSFMNVDLSALIHKKFKGNISSFGDLLDQQEVNYGTLREGETYRFMSMSSDPTIMGLQRFIYRNAYLLVNSRQEGIEKALNSKYAFIQESVANQYATDLNCNLTIIDSEKEYYIREYAIALQKGREDLLELFNQGLKLMKSDGTLDKLKRKYWNKYCNSGVITSNSYVITSICLVVWALVSHLSLN